MSYEQAMKHSRNHRKDRFVQQCSGYAGDGVSQQMSEAQIKGMEIHSFIELLVNAKEEQEMFPIYIANSGGLYHIVPENHLFGHRIEKYAELVEFGEKYVLDKERLEEIVNEIKEKNN